MRRLVLALFGAAILAVGAGSVPAAAAPSQVARASSAAQTTTQDSKCSPSDSSGGRVCVALVSSTFVGQATVRSYPADCAGYRVSLYDPGTGLAVASTSLRPCGETPSKQVTAGASRFVGLTAYAEFTMYDSDGIVIKLVYTDNLTYNG